MQALIAENAYIKNKSQLSQAERIAEELNSLGVFVEIKKNFCLAEIAANQVKTHKYDFCVFLDKDRVAACLLERAGIRLFNSAQAIEVCDDKMLTNAALAGLDIPLPDCVYAPLCYYADSAEDSAFLERVAQTLGFPLVAKTNYGSLGAGVTLIKDFTALVSYERAHMLLPHFYQKFIDCGRGEDTRVIVVGDRCVCAMKRVNDNDFRSNIELGGRGEKTTLTAEVEKLCLKVTKVLGLDYCGIDILQDRQGAPYVCEVNSNAFFAAAERVCGVNVAKEYAAHMLSEMKK